MQSKEGDKSATEVRSVVDQADAVDVTSRNDIDLAEEFQPITQRGNGSVAHQIIGQFLDAMGKDDGYAEIAKRLSAVVFSGRVNEADLRAAIFGEIEL